MNQIELLLGALHNDPADQTTWLALADALEEDGQIERAELTRLTCRLRGSPFGEGAADQQRVQELLESGVKPCVPELVNSVGMRFALIPAGRFLMGSPEDEQGRRQHEGPQHEVEITRAFYLGVHPVTQEQYEKVMGSNPGWFSSTGGGKDKVIGLDTKPFPVEMVSWDDAQTFLKKLAASPDEEKRRLIYRLPTEAEWEYSCRGGFPWYSTFHFGNSLSSSQANFGGTLGRTSEVGSYPSNAFGLSDMHGNVWEWCRDWYANYSARPYSDPAGPPKGGLRVFRGGSCGSGSSGCRSAHRATNTPGRRSIGLGFRVLAVLSGQ